MSIGSLQQLPLSCMLPSAQQIESLNNYTWLQIVTILPCLTAIAIGKYCTYTPKTSFFLHYLEILILVVLPFPVNRLFSMLHNDTFYCTSTVDRRPQLVDRILYTIPADSTVITIHYHSIQIPRIEITVKRTKF